MIKRILVSIALFIVSFFVFYLMAAFMAFDLNPNNWDFGMRAFTAVFGTCIGMLMIGIYSMNDGL